MRNIFLDDRTALDIDAKVARIHQDLRHPTGRIELAEVRELLKLDLRYYSAQDPDLLQEVVHKLKLGARDIVRQPGRLIQVIKQFALKALFLPDRRRILIDANLPDLKKRWNEGHEILHSAIPWHADYMLGDDKLTLSPACHERIEAEANYGTGRLLFPSDPFREMVGSAPLNLAHVRAIAGHFGNTITTTLWRVVENSEGILFGMIGEHPHHPKPSEPDVAYFVRSRAFVQQFGSVSEPELFELLRGYCYRRKSGPLGEMEVILRDTTGAEHVFLMESFSNSHNVLTLGIYRRPHAAAVAGF